MKARLNDVQEALKRKLGPLPVWAWAIIVGGALFVYRVRGGAVGDSAAAASPTDSDGTDAGGGASYPDPQDPVTLAPGESAYNPGTGQLVGTAPEQQEPPEPQDPVVLDPGQSVYDPDTGKFWGGGDPMPNAPKAPATKKPAKRTPKRKATHTKSTTPKHKPTKKRSVAKLHHPRPAKPRTGHAPVKAKAHAGPKPAAAHKRVVHKPPVVHRKAPVRPRAGHH